MYLTKLTLDNFRSYRSQSFDLDPKINLIIGPNGSGKSNILESIYLLASGKSFRSSSLSKLVNWNSSFSLIRGVLLKNNENINLEVQLTKDPAKASTLRRFLIESVPKTRAKYLGVLKTVIFHPEDIRLVTGSPSRRREFLDSIFQTSQWRYTSALSQYNRALKHRNELLDQIRLGKNQKSETFYWDQSLVKNSEIIHQHRQDFIESVNYFFTTHPNSEISTISINYYPSILTPEKLQNNFAHDLDRGYTQFGPHRDDFTFDNSVFPSADKNLAFWGSRGQQRLATLALRLAQIDYFHRTYSESPILLLDDIFSELDYHHRNLVTKVCQKYQTIFTSSEEGIISILPKAHVIRL
ncbi:MAG: DNA replication/repair protein RecF [Candidatus Shapirobacteria bacterium]